MRNRKMKRGIAAALCVAMLFSNQISTLETSASAEVPEGMMAEENNGRSGQNPMEEEASPAAESAEKSSEISASDNTAETEEDSETEENSGTEQEAEQEAVTEETTGIEENTTETDYIENDTTENNAAENLDENTELSEGVETLQEEVVEAEEAFTETYDDGHVTVSVSAGAGVFPADTQMKVTPVDKIEISEDTDPTTQQLQKEINDWYDATEKSLQESAKAEEKELGGFVAYDISFWHPSEEGVLTEVEPQGEVKVDMSFVQAAAPQQFLAEKKDGQQETAEISVIHMKEEGDAIIPETISDAVLTKTEDGKGVSQAAFTAASFSIFTITWTHSGLLHDGQLTNEAQPLELILVDSKGKKLEETELEAELENNGDWFSRTAEEINQLICSKSENIKNNYVFQRAYTSVSPEKNIHKIHLHKDTALKDPKATWFKVEYAGNTNDKYQLNKKDKVYFVYDRKAEEVSTDSDKIQIHLFNYDKDINNNSFASAFQFYSWGEAKDGIQQDDSGVLTYKAQAEGILHTGIVERNLENGYPVLRKDVYDKTESLQKIFPKTETDEIAGVQGVAQKERNLQGLFQKDKKGYYYYDSEKNAASLVGDQIKVYDGMVCPSSSNTADHYGQFLPFNTVNDPASNLPTVCKGMVTQYEKAKTDMWFGMNVSFRFSQPEAGKINRENMKFHFSGDDDVWVFIDGKLVLDLGGIHARVDGDIDFATGKVTMTEHTESGDRTTETTIVKQYREAFNALGEDLDESLFNGDTFKDYTQHTLEFFYLERGSGASNCSLRFNMQPIPTGALTIGKKIEGYEEDVNQDEEFSFQLYLKDEAAKEFQLVTGQEIEILSPAQESRKETIKEDGIFNLKHNERAVFAEIPKGTFYYIKECNLSEKYGEVSMKTEAGEITDKEGAPHGIKKEGEESFSVSMIQTIDEAPEVDVRNKPNKKMLHQIKITKKVTGASSSQKKFQVNVQVNGMPYTGAYTIGITSYEAENGVITLKADETAVLEGNISIDEKKGFLEGSVFAVEEEEAEKYKAVYEIKDAEVMNLTETTGKLLKEDAKVTITNKIGSITVKKFIEGTEPDREDDFMITLSEGEICYSMTLNHYEEEADGRKIFLDDDRTLTVREIIPQEYNQTENAPVIEIYKDGKKETEFTNGTAYDFEMSEEYEVHIKNTFTHTNYFHNKASVDNKFASLS